MKTMFRSITLAVFAGLMLAGGQIGAKPEKKEKTVGHYVKWALIMAGGAAVCTTVAGVAFPEIIVQIERMDRLEKGVGSGKDLARYFYDASALESEILAGLRPNFILAGLGSVGAGIFSLGALYNGLAATGKGISSFYNKFYGSDKKA